jgi:hypothetical protein
MENYIDECEFICTWNIIATIYYSILYYYILFQLLDLHLEYFILYYLFPDT